MLCACRSSSRKETFLKEMVKREREEALLNAINAVVDSRQSAEISMQKGNQTSYARALDNGTRHLQSKNTTGSLEV